MTWKATIINGKGLSLISTKYRQNTLMN